MFKALMSIRKEITASSFYDSYSISLVSWRDKFASVDESERSKYVSMAKEFAEKYAPGKSLNQITVYVDIAPEFSIKYRTLTLF